LAPLPRVTLVGRGPQLYRAAGAEVVWEVSDDFAARGGRLVDRIVGDEDGRRGVCDSETISRSNFPCG